MQPSYERLAGRLKTPIDRTRQRLALLQSQCGLSQKLCGWGCFCCWDGPGPVCFRFFRSRGVRLTHSPRPVDPPPSRRFYYFTPPPLRTNPDLLSGTSALKSEHPSSALFSLGSPWPIPVCWSLARFPLPVPDRPTVAFLYQNIRPNIGRYY